MPYRNIFIANRASLRIKNGQLIITNDEDTFSFPTEDIRSVVIDNTLSTISVGAINKLAEDGVCVIVCNEKHMPSCKLLPISSYHRMNKRITLQFDQSKPKLKRLWQKIVTAKIENQAECLRLNCIQTYEDLRSIAKTVQSGDVTNREGYAANLYFKALFDKGFTRDEENDINAALNYGYAIIRSYIAKTVVCEGLEPSIGIHHRNELNRFNLADDLIEPFRPAVDLYVYENFKRMESEFNSFQKAQLVKLLNCKTIMDGKNCSLAHAAELLVQSLVCAFEKEEADLKLPTIVHTDYFTYD